MAATCSVAEEIFGSTKKIKWSWTADSAGNVASSTSGATTSNAYNGLVQALTTVGASGSSAPTASYDINVYDQSSVDVLLGAGANRAAATEHTKAASLGVVANDTLKLKVANAGASNAGTVYLFIR